VTGLLKRQTLVDLAAYLARHPDERKALRVLERQLQDTDDPTLERNHWRGHITTSAVILDASRARMLMIHHRLYDLWLQPGGHYEPPGDLWASAVREVAEETGVGDVAPFPHAGGPALLDVDTHAIPANPARDEPAHVHHDFAFIASASDGCVPRPQLAEVHACRWVALTEVQRFPLERTRRLATKAMAAVQRDRSEAAPKARFDT